MNPKFPALRRVRVSIFEILEIGRVFHVSKKRRGVLELPILSMANTNADNFDDTRETHEGRKSAKAAPGEDHRRGHSIDLLSPKIRILSRNAKHSGCGRPVKSL